MQELYFLEQLVLAVVLGAVLGAQRQRRGRWAGLRTYALVTAGATLFTVLGLNAFFAAQSGAIVAAQIITGIGFLGAGTILHKEDRVEGLTTAAGLWVAAAIGMAVGVQYFLLAIGTTALIFLVLMIDDRRFRGKEKVE